MARVEVTLTRNYFKQVTVEMEVPDEMVSGDDCSKVSLTTEQDEELEETLASSSLQEADNELTITALDNE